MDGEQNTRRSVPAGTPLRIALAALFVLIAGIDAAPVMATATPSQVYTSMAVDGMRQLDHDFYAPTAGLYAATEDMPVAVASLWPTTQVLSAAIHLAALTHDPRDVQRVRRIIASLSQYLGPLGVYHAKTTPSTTYYDDNNWVALDMLDAYDLLHDPAYLAVAERIFAFETTGWDGAQGGGIFWAVGDGDRNTVSTAPPIVIGLRLATITGRSRYVTWAERCYAWQNATLQAPDGLYWDHVKPDGTIDARFYSYVQALMIDANLAFAAYTHLPQYLERARAIAAATAGLHPGPWHSQDMIAVFDSIYYEALARLDQASPGAATFDVARDYLSWATPTAEAHRALIDEDDLFEQAAYIIDAAVLAGE